MKFRSRRDVRAPRTDPAGRIVLDQPERTRISLGRIPLVKRREGLCFSLQITPF